MSDNYLSILKGVVSLTYNKTWNISITHFNIKFGRNDIIDYQNSLMLLLWNVRINGSMVMVMVRYQSTHMRRYERFYACKNILLFNS